MSADSPAFTTSVLAEMLGGTLSGRGDLVVRGVNSIEEARPDELTFIADHHHARLWGGSKAFAAIMSDRLSVQDHDPDTRCLVKVSDAEIGMIRALELFLPPEAVPDIGIHPMAFVHPSVEIGKNVRIGSHASVQQGCRLGDGVVLHPGVRLYSNVEVGTGSILHCNVVVRHGCRLGRGVVLHQGVSIGADGFGYRPDPAGRVLLKVPHVGSVIIDDEVEIGANACVDRGKFGATVIGAGTKIDNLVQVGHNVKIGRCCVIAGNTGIAGSAVVGDGVQIGGNAGISDHVTIGAGCKIGAHSLVMSDMPPGRKWVGYPADEGQAVLRQWASIRKLPDLLRRLSRQFPADKEPSKGPSARAQ
jgi:UDP-3-O-[3-hydroxymyristoyl] glucosamine N-acyltransferase